MEISLSSNSITDDHIATKFGTCHDSPAVVPCAKYCSDHFISIWMGAKWNFHHIWIVMDKSLVKWAPVLESQMAHSAGECPQLGKQHKSCHSVNYNNATATCKLNIKVMPRMLWTSRLAILSIISFLYVAGSVRVKNYQPRFVHIHLLFV